VVGCDHVWYLGDRRDGQVYQILFGVIMPEAIALLLVNNLTIVIGVPIMAMLLKRCGYELHINIEPKLDIHGFGDGGWDDDDDDDFDFLPDDGGLGRTVNVEQEDWFDWLHKEN
jgi:hypothetical protein